MRTVFQTFWRWETARLFFFLFVLLGGASVFALTPSLLPSTLISCLLFFVFAPIVDALERKGISRTSGIAGVFLACGCAIALSTSWVTPRVSQEIDAFQKGKSRYASYGMERLQAQEKKLVTAYPVFKEARLTEKLLNWITASASRLWGIAPNFASQLLVCLLLVPFLTFVLLRDAHELRRQLLKLVPNRYFETIYSLMSRILDEMGGYVAARILEAALVGLIVMVGCLALQIPYAILLAAFAAATNAIPYLGPLLGAVPGLTLAVLEPAVHNQLLWTLLIYTAANVVDMAVIFPLVVARIVNLHPVIVVVSVFLGSQFFGILGMIVAVPITSILKILIQEVYSRVYNPGEALR